MPAVLLGDRHPEQAELLHLLHDGLREGVLVVVVLGVGKDLLVDELAHHLGDVALDVGLLVVSGGFYGHGSCSGSEVRTEPKDIDAPAHAERKAPAKRSTSSSGRPASRAAAGQRATAPSTSPITSSTRSAARR